MGNINAQIVHLGLIRKGQSAIVQSLAAGGADSAEDQALTLRLAELGFVPEECVRVVAESFPRGYPIAVRVGNTTFALRKHEAERVLVARCDGAQAGTAATDAEDCA